MPLVTKFWVWNIIEKELARDMFGDENIIKMQMIFLRVNGIQARARLVTFANQSFKRQKDN